MSAQISSMSQAQMNTQDAINYSKTADGATVYNTALAYPVGILAAVLFLGIFLYSIKKRDVKPQYETLGK